MAGKDKKSKDEPVKKRSTKVLIFMVLISLAMVVVFRLGFVFILLAMLPTVVAFYIDISKSRSTFHTVFACNLAGVLPFVSKILAATSSNGAVSQLMSNTVNWLIVYSAAGFGWILVYAMPIGAQIFINNMHQRQISRLQRLQSRIVQEWGREVEANSGTHVANDSQNANPKA